MKGIKIFVFSLKEVIKSLTLFITGILIIAFLIFMFVPKNTEETDNSLYIPGEYTSSFYLNDSLANIIVTVTDKEIVGISLVPLTETQEVFYPMLEPLMEQLSSKIISSQSTEFEVDINNMQTSRLLLTAIDKALSEATIVR